MSLFKSLTGFLGKYADEADAVATALNMMVDQLAIQPQDKAQIKAHIRAIGDAPERIRDFLANAKDTPALKLDAADVNRAVANVLKDKDAFADAIDTAVAARLDKVLEDSPTLRDRVAELVEAEITRRLGDGSGPLADPARDLRTADAGDKLRAVEPVRTDAQIDAGDKGGDAAGKTDAKTDTATKTDAGKTKA